MVNAENTNDLNCVIHIANNMMKERKPIKQYPDKIREIYGELEYRLRTANTLWMAVADNGEPFVDPQNLPWVFTEEKYAEKAVADMQKREIIMTLEERSPAELFALLREKGYTSFVSDASHAGVNLSLECMFLGNYSAADVAEMDIHHAIRVYNAARKQAERQGAPVLINPQLTATAISAIDVSQVSPDLCESICL